MRKSNETVIMYVPRSKIASNNKTMFAFHETSEVLYYFSIMVTVFT